MWKAVGPPNAWARHRTSEDRRWVKALAPACLMLLLASSLLAACGGRSTSTDTSSPTATVQGFEDTVLAVGIADILLSGPTIVDFKPGSATLLAESSIDLVCAVAYGLSTDYGQIATDLDMAAGGHGDHHPVLTGLEPDTLYHYRLGGMGPDGTVYRSDDLTFRTPPEDDEQRQASSENVALSGQGTTVVGVSRNFGGGGDNSTWGANNVIDGDLNTQWSSAGNGDDAWIELELPTVTHATSIRFWTRTMGTSAQIFSFQVVTDRGETYGPFELDDAEAVHYFDVDLTAERLRFEAIDTSGGNTGAVEIEVYGQPVP